VTDPLDDLTPEPLGLRPEFDDEGEPDDPPPESLLIDIRTLSSLLDRSVAALERDATAGRLPKAVRLGGSRKWVRAEIEEWVDAGCPTQDEWDASRAAK
jgi:predicted DNA-binding transcriptional regulator AlpA